MKVYVVSYSWDYEGENTRGVYSSIEKAREAVAAADDKDYVDHVFIYEIEVDAPAGHLSVNGKKTEIE